MQAAQGCTGPGPACSERVRRPPAAGATDGIGAHTALRLAAHGGTVLVHGRSEERVLKAAQAVEVAGRGSGGGARPMVADFASLAGVRGLAEQVWWVQCDG